MRLASLCYTGLKLSGLPALARRLQRGGVILCYHNVIAETDAGLRGSLGLHMPLPVFARQVRWLAGNYEIVSLEEFVSRLSRGDSLRGVAAVTFDDGYAGVFEHAWPLLRALAIPATVFVVAQAPGESEGFWWDHPDVQRAYSPARRHHWLTAFRGDGATIVESLTFGRSASRTGHPTPDWQTIRDAARSGLRLGVHSGTHRALTELDERDLLSEVLDSRDVITRQTGVTPEFFAYPYGLWNDRVRQAVRAAGYRAAFTIEYGHNAVPADLWALRRVNVPAEIEDAAFEARIAGLDPRAQDG